LGCRAAKPFFPRNVAHLHQLFTTGYVHADIVPPQTGGPQNALCLGPDTLWPIAAVIATPQRSLQRVAEVDQEFAALARHHISMDKPRHAALVESLCQRRVRRIVTRRIPPDIEQPQLRCAVADNDTGHRVGGGHHDGHAMHIRKQPERHRLIRDAVLQADQ
jgi:hypothetical protein